LLENSEVQSIYLGGRRGGNRLGTEKT
jgi:hypothetical protein